MVGVEGVDLSCLQPYFRKVGMASGEPPPDIAAKLALAIHLKVVYQISCTSVAPETLLRVPEALEAVIGGPLLSSQVPQFEQSARHQEFSSASFSRRCPPPRGSMFGISQACFVTHVPALDVTARIVPSTCSVDNTVNSRSHSANQMLLPSEARPRWSDKV